MLHVKLLLLLACASLAYSQTFGDVSGEVKDSTAPSFSQAKVTATNTGTHTSRETLTNEAGIYRFPWLVPGMYAVRVEAGGFPAAVRSNIELQVQQSASNPAAGFGRIRTTAISMRQVQFGLKYIF